MKKTVFVDIDTQNDFILDDGKLTVHAEDMIPIFQRLNRYAKDNDIPLLSSMDAHTPDDPEFEEFGAHCVVGTEGQKKVEGTVLDNSKTFSYKNEVKTDWASEVENHDHLIFETVKLDVFSNPNFDRIVKELDADRFVVYGIATEYCVKEAVMGLRKRGMNTYLVTDAVRGISDEDATEAIEEMKDDGAVLTTTDELLSE